MERRNNRIYFSNFYWKLFITQKIECIFWHLLLLLLHCLPPFVWKGNKIWSAIYWEFSKFKYYVNLTQWMERIKVNNDMIVRYKNIIIESKHSWKSNPIRNWSKLKHKYEISKTIIYLNWKQHRNCGYTGRKSLSSYSNDCTPFCLHKLLAFKLPELDGKTSTTFYHLCVIKHLNGNWCVFLRKIYFLNQHWWNEQQLKCICIQRKNMWFYED